MKTKILLITLFITNYGLSQAELVKDIYTGPSSGMPVYSNNRVDLNGNLIFAAYDITNRMELWKTDGTTAGTFLLKDLVPGSYSGTPNSLYKWGNEIYFAGLGTTTQTYDYEFWKTDGTTSGTVLIKDISFNQGSYPGFFTSYNNLLYFKARAGGTGFELFASNGTGTGTNMVGIGGINPGSASSTPHNFTEVNGKLFFAATHVGVGTELFFTTGNSGNNVVFVKDIFSGTTSSNPEKFISFNNKLYFTANNDTNGIELWESVGIFSSTKMVADLFNGATGSNPSYLTIFNGELYFSANDGLNGIELFKVNTLGNIVPVADISALSSDPKDLFVYNGELYFSADDGINGRELWKTGGNSTNTNLVKDINTTGSSIPTNFIEYNAKLYFSADNGVNGIELWVTDGTATGTILVADINPSGNSSPSYFKISNNILYFSANNGVVGNELWKYQTCTVYGTVSASTCDSYISPSGKYTWITTGVYQDTLVAGSTLGCDSIITINLTINTATTSIINQTTCNSFTSPSGNYTWTATGTYYDTIPNAANCDSILTINLTINLPTQGTLTVSSCDSFLSPSGKNWVTTGTYLDTLFGANITNCDSIITVYLTIDNPLDTSVTISNFGVTLTSNETFTGATYQWVDCNNSYATVSGEANQIFTATTNVNYAVVVSYNGSACSDTSACYIINNVGISGNSLESLINIYPNPTTNNITVNYGNLKVVNISITNVNGKEIITNLGTSINLSKLPNGIYFLKLQTNNNSYYKRFIK